MTDKVTQAELDQVISKHVTFTIGKRGGARAVLKFKNLSGLQFKAADLSGADFTGSDFTGANLSNGKFNGTIFYGCVMTGANLKGASFPRADMRGVDLTSAMIENADLATADMRQGKVEKRLSLQEQKSLLEEENKSSENIIDYSRTEEFLRGNDLNLPQQTVETRISDLILRAEKAMPARNTDLSLEKSDAASRDTDLFLKNELSPILTSGLNLSVTEDALYQKFRAHAIWIKTGGAEGLQLDISDFDMRSIKDIGHYPLIMSKAKKTNFSGLFFGQAQMQSSDFERSDFSFCEMKESDFRGSNLTKADFEKADLSSCNFSPLQLPNNRSLATNLSGVNFKGAKLTNARLRMANLSGADFTGADLSGADLRDANLADTILPERR